MFEFKPFATIQKLNFHFGWAIGKFSWVVFIENILYQVCVKLICSNKSTKVQNSRSDPDKCINKATNIS